MSIWGPNLVNIVPANTIAPVGARASTCTFLISISLYITFKWDHHVQKYNKSPLLPMMLQCSYTSDTALCPRANCFKLQKITKGGVHPTYDISMKFQVCLKLSSLSIKQNWSQPNLILYLTPQYSCYSIYKNSPWSRWGERRYKHFFLIVL